MYRGIFNYCKVQLVTGFVEFKIDKTIRLLADGSYYWVITTHLLAWCIIWKIFATRNLICVRVSTLQESWLVMIIVWVVWVWRMTAWRRAPAPGTASLRSGTEPPTSAGNMSTSSIPARTHTHTHYSFTGTICTPAPTLYLRFNNQTSTFYCTYYEQRRCKFTPTPPYAQCFEHMPTLPAAVFSAKRHAKPVYIKCDQIQLKLRLLKLKTTKT